MAGVPPRAMDVGELSDVIQTESGLHVILRTPVQGDEQPEEHQSYRASHILVSSLWHVWYFLLF